MTTMTLAPTLADKTIILRILMLVISTIVFQKVLILDALTNADRYLEPRLPCAHQLIRME